MPNWPPEMPIEAPPFGPTDRLPPNRPNRPPAAAPMPAPIGPPISAPMPAPAPMPEITLPALPRINWPPIVAINAAGPMNEPKPPTAPRPVVPPVIREPLPAATPPPSSRPAAGSTPPAPPYAAAPAMPSEASEAPKPSSLEIPLPAELKKLPAPLNRLPALPTSPPELTKLPRLPPELPPPLSSDSGLNPAAPAPENPKDEATLPNPTEPRIEPTTGRNTRRAAISAASLMNTCLMTEAKSENDFTPPEKTEANMSENAPWMPWIAFLNGSSHSSCSRLASAMRPLVRPISSLSASCCRFCSSVSPTPSRRSRCSSRRCSSACCRASSVWLISASSVCAKASSSFFASRAALLRASTLAAAFRFRRLSYWAASFSISSALTPAAAACSLNISTSLRRCCSTTAALPLANAALSFSCASACSPSSTAFFCASAWNFALSTPRWTDSSAAKLVPGVVAALICAARMRSCSAPPARPPDR